MSPTPFDFAHLDRTVTADLVDGAAPSDAAAPSPAELDLLLDVAVGLGDLVADERDRLVTAVGAVHEALADGG